MVITPLSLIALEWTALGIGTAGTILWSLGKNQLAVSLLWMVSSLLWIAFALTNDHYGLTARDVLGLVLYGIGIRTYWLEQRATVTGKSGDESPRAQSSVTQRTPDPSCPVCHGAGVHTSSGPGTTTCACVQSTLVRLAGH